MSPVQSDTRMSPKSAEMGLVKLQARYAGKQLLLQIRIHEAVGDDFAIAAVGHRGQHSIVRHSRFGRFAGDLRRDGMALGNAVEAPQTRHLLDQILLDSYVEAMRRSVHPPAIGSGLDPIADRASSTAAPRHRARRCRAAAPRARGATAPIRLGFELATRLAQCGSPAQVRVHHQRCRSQQRRRAFDGHRRQARIDAALEALRGIGE